MLSLKFEEMNLSKEIIRAVEDMGFEEATPIQAQTISRLMEGRDITGQSQTGSGKTSAFGIPCIENIDVDDKSLQAVILSPTRELAIQICEEFRKLLKYKDNIKVVPVYGGQPIDRQINALRKGVQIVVGTPGRIMDHMKRHTLKMKNVKMVVLDEADEMLDMGFREDIEKILSKMPEQRQTVLFSATMPDEILSLSKQYQISPEFVKVERKELTVPSITQKYLELKERTKIEAVSRLVDMYCPELTMVFCNTKKRVDEVVDQLQGRGYNAEGLHGDMKQLQRDAVMKKFRNGATEILVATDVAARGIDVDDVELVINYDVPSDAEYYVHRIGRTGRAGREGMAYTLVVGKEVYRLKDIMKYTNKKIKLGHLPSVTDINEARINKYLEQIRTEIEENHLSMYINIVEKLQNEDYSTMDIAAALLKLNLNDVFIDNIDDDLDDSDNYKMIYVNIGRNHRVGPKDILGAFAGESGIPGKEIGDIIINDAYSLVEVPNRYVKDVLKGMKNKKIKKVPVKVAISKEY